MRLSLTFGALLYVLIVNFSHYAAGAGMIEVFGWKQMDFYNRGENQQSTGLSTKPNKGNGNIIFPDRLSRNRRAMGVVTSRDQPLPSVSTRWRDANQPAINSSYIPYNNVPMGVAHYNSRLFITMPRRRTGIPSTLNYIDLRRDGKNSSPKLNAYPNFETNYLSQDFQPNSNRIISVYRIAVDATCKRLWFIDTGMLEYPNNRMQIQRPSIWIMDLSNDRLLHRFEISQSIVETGRGLASLTIDVKPQQCNHAYAYIPDLVNNQLYVYSLFNNRIWAFAHNYFNFDPIAGDLRIGGQSFRWDDGIFSVTLGPILGNGYRNVFFHPMASNNEFMVSSEVLQNEANAARSDHGNDFTLMGNRGASRQSTMHEFDARSGVVFYAEIQRNGVGCWNVNKPFTAENHGTVMQDEQRMIYPSDLTIDDEGTIWVMSNSMPIFIYSNLDPSIVNFRVWKQNVFQAAQQTVCAP